MKKQIYFFGILSIALILTIFAINQINFEKTTVAKVTGNQIFADLSAWNNETGKSDGSSCSGEGYDIQCATCLTCEHTLMNQNPPIWGYSCEFNPDYQGLSDPTCPSTSPICVANPITPFYDCIDCYTDTHCPNYIEAPDYKYCHLNTCHECSNFFNNGTWRVQEGRAACKDLYGDQAPRCEDDVCVPCELDEECQFQSTMACVNHECKQCSSDGHCQAYEDRTHCSSNTFNCQNSYNCVQCKSDDDCGEGQTCNNCTCQ